MCPVGLQRCQVPDLARFLGLFATIEPCVVVVLNVWSNRSRFELLSAPGARMQMNEVVNAYRTARSTARRRWTVQLSWQEARARGRAHAHDLDEVQLARFAAV